MKVVIMAGGKGTRIAQLAVGIPKPMLRIGGEPVLAREIRCLKEQGYDDILITVGHLGRVIQDYFGDGKAQGVHIEYYVEETPLGNAGALLRLRDRLKDDFLLLNGDAIFDVDINRFVAHHKRCGGLATLFTHPNGHPYDSEIVVADSGHRVIRWLSREEERKDWYKNRVNAGLHILSPELLEGSFGAGRVDLDRQILKPLAGTGKMFCYDSPEYVKDMGTPERFEAVCEDDRRGIVHGKSLKEKQRAIFLDRDGTINRYVGFVRSAEEMELLPDAAEAIRRINASGYLVIVATNQPVLARGETSSEELERIHNKMETLLGREGAYLDGIYYCPHHPDRGFAGEVVELKMDCACRKPKPGLLLRAAQDLNIDLSRSWMVGDGRNDELAGRAAGCRTLRIQQNGSLLSAVEKILG